MPPPQEQSQPSSAQVLQCANGRSDDVSRCWAQSPTSRFNRLQEALGSAGDDSQKIKDLCLTTLQDFIAWEAGLWKDLNKSYSEWDMILRECTRVMKELEEKRQAQARYQRMLVEVQEIQALLKTMDKQLEDLIERLRRW